MELKYATLGMVLMAAAAQAQVSTIEAYCLSQLPNNSVGSITPQTLRNCINYLTENLSTVPYTGQVSSVYPLVALGANISGTVSATAIRTTTVSATNISATTGTYNSLGIGSLTASGVVSANALDAFFVSGTSVNGTSGNFTGVTTGVLVASGAVSSGTVSTNSLTTPIVIPAFSTVTPSVAVIGALSWNTSGTLCIVSSTAVWVKVVSPGTSCRYGAGSN